MTDVNTVRRLVIRSFHVHDVRLGGQTELTNHVLVVDDSVHYSDSYIKNVTVKVIAPQKWDCVVNTIMDIIPISTKVLGELGEGITHTLTGVYVMLTGVDEDGRQLHEFGASNGVLQERLYKNRPGTPNNTDFLIHIDVLLKGGLPYTRSLPMAAFKVADTLIDSIRIQLKEEDGRRADEVHEYYDTIKKDAKKVVIIKQIAGQGAMYDNMLFSSEPSGMDGISIIDMANMPVLLSPNEYRDGALRAMV